MLRAYVAVALAVVALAAAPGVADDDDDVLETRPLGKPIPERLEQLERDWARDVGLGDEEGRDEADEAEPADDESEPAAPLVEDEAPPAAPASPRGLAAPTDEEPQ